MSLCQKSECSLKTTLLHFVNFIIFYVDMYRVFCLFVPLCIKDSDGGYTFCNILKMLLISVNKIPINFTYSVCSHAYFFVHKSYFVYITFFFFSLALLGKSGVKFHYVYQIDSCLQKENQMAA